MAYGLLSTGFAPKPLTAIIADIEAAETSGISASLNLLAPEPIGVLNGIVGAALDELWQLAAALYNGMSPDTAVDDQLTSLALITGTMRLAATKTQVLACDVTTSAGFAGAAIGEMFASVVSNPAAQFTNKAAVPAGVNTLYDVDFEAVVAGPTQCLAGTLTVIAQPLSGWTSITNPSDGVVGSEIETNADLRLRRTAELAAAGSTTAFAIKSDVLAQMVPPGTTINGVFLPVTVTTTSCTVLYNDTELTDANGLPPHSIEVIARAVGATEDDDIALATLILADKAAGITTFGTDFEEITDSQGNVENVYFTRPADTTLTVTITVVVDALTYAGDADVKTALANYATAVYQPGVDVVFDALRASVFPSPFSSLVGVAGVLDVTAFTVNGGTMDIAIDIRHVATLSTGDITVTVA